MNFYLYYIILLLYYLISVVNVRANSNLAFGFGDNSLKSFHNQILFIRENNLHLRLN